MTLAALALTRRVDLLLTLKTLIACRARALGVVTLVDLGVGVTQLDGDIALQLVLETDGLDLGDGLDHGGFPVSDVTDGTDVDGGLAGDNFGGQRGQRREVQGGRVRLFGQDGALRGLRGIGLLHGRLDGLLTLIEGLLILNLTMTVGAQDGGTGMGLLIGKVTVGRHDCGSVIPTLSLTKYGKNQETGGG